VDEGLDLIEFFHVEVDVVEIFVEVEVLPFGEFFLDKIPVDLIYLAGVDNLVIFDLREVLQKFILLRNHLLLLEFLDQLARSLVPDIRQLLFLLDSLHLRILVPFLVLRIGFGLVLQFVEGLQVEATCKFE
jgi:hypothetical protein